MIALALALATVSKHAPAHAVLAKPTACGDLLARLGHKPPGLVFERCRYLPDQQGKPLEATYRVSGARAAAVERYFHRAIGMARMKRICCMWEAPDAQFWVHRQWYEVVMGTGETLVDTRAGWGGIPQFTVLVETYTEEI